jgi:hypothetical protein
MYRRKKIRDTLNFTITLLLVLVVSLYEYKDPCESLTNWLACHAFDLNAVLKFGTFFFKATYIQWVYLLWFKTLLLQMLAECVLFLSADRESECTLASKPQRRFPKATTFFFRLSLARTARQTKGLPSEISAQISICGQSRGTKATTQALGSTLRKSESFSDALISPRSL